jgi:hypothetical protein
MIIVGVVEIIGLPRAMPRAMPVAMPVAVLAQTQGS